MGERMRSENMGMAEGSFYDAAVLGTVRGASLGEFQQYIVDRGGEKTMPYAKAFEEVEASQPWDPTAPGKPFLEDMRFELLDKLGIDDARSPQVRAYTAVGSHLDKGGVDAYFRVGDDIVTVDLTLREDREKYLQTRADLVITGEMPSPLSEEYLPWIEHWAGLAMEQLKHGTKYKQGAFNGPIYFSPRPTRS